MAWLETEPRYSSPRFTRDVFASVGDLSGPIHTFRIPKAVFAEWVSRDLAGRTHTMMGNKYISEVYFTNGAMGSLKKYRVK